MQNPIAEMDGDEMTRVIWRMVKATLLEPYVGLNTEYFDLGLTHRNDTDDQVTVQSAEAAKRLRVAVKCATITPNRQRMEEFPELKQMWKSANGTIRAILDGTVFRAPIVLRCVKPSVRTWEAPITIARHAYGDVYSGVECYVGEKNTAELVIKSETGDVLQTIQTQTVDSPAVWRIMHNKDSSIEAFARSCFGYAAATKQDLWFSTKDTISKIYDGRFKDIFAQIYESDFKAEFARLGIEYFYTLIDDAVARVMRSRGGFIWALKNYDGDVMSDMVSTAFGSLAMMTSVLVSPDGNFLYEAAHGTVTRHYYRYLQGEETSTNAVATIFAWTGALAKRGELDGNAELTAFAKSVEKATLDTIESGTMTRDLAGIAEPGLAVKTVATQEFLNAVKARLEI
ncbi:MAG: NADP-dependent isocitrate dehydrogenase [Oscillospiraceae bacterium]|jgi:isocitrate dehydrogenase|nr:NADP-dependent isocitrate dehydrogenase [Oscillospiraceae bacterium]